MFARNLILVVMAWLVMGAAAPSRLPAGTAVKVALAHGVSAKTAHPGDRVVLRTIGPVIHNGSIVIPEGATVIGMVTKVETTHGGRPGFVAIEAEAVTLEDGGRIALDGTLVREGEDYRRAVAGGGGAMAGASLTIPLGRRNATPNLTAGTPFIAYTARDY